ncbi:MAG: phosphotransferase [Patescibacteria group bacterium]
MIDLEKALLNPRAYDSKTKRVKLIKSLVNFVFLTDNFVYKIKQPTVRFEGKINYTTLANRKRATLEEYKVNKIFSPSIHIGVVPIRAGTNSNIGINIGGKTLDYALKIKRLPENCELSELIRLHKVKNKDVILLADTLRRIHQKLPRRRRFARYASLRSLQQRWQETFDWMQEPHMKKIVAANFYHHLTAWHKKYSRLFHLLLAARQPFTQRIHGDLNTENIFYVRGTYHFIDVNQLLKEWEYGDPLNDVGAIAKDFDAYGQDELGNLFVTSYLGGLTDSTTSVVQFYKMYWAAIRYSVYADILARRARKEWKRTDMVRAKLYRILVERYLRVP